MSRPSAPRGEGSASGGKVDRIVQCLSPDGERHKLCKRGTHMNSQERVEIAVLGALRAPVMAALEEKFIVHRVFEARDPLAALSAAGSRIRGAATHGMAGISRAQIEALPRLEICAIHGVGLETSDVEACRERGIVLTIA